MNFHQAIDRNATNALKEIHLLSTYYYDEIADKVNFYIRSEAQLRRWNKAQKITQGNEK